MKAAILQDLSTHDRKLLRAFYTRVKAIAHARDIKVWEAIEVVASECKLYSRK